MRTRAHQLCVIGTLTAFWIFLSVQVITKYLPRVSYLALVLGAVFIVGLHLLWIRGLRRAWKTPRWSVWALWLLLIAAFVVAYPRSQRQLDLTHGSDREDALRVEWRAIEQHQPPLEARTFARNHPTPLPGAMLLAYPFYKLGRIAYQNVFWSALLAALLLAWFRSPLSASLCFAMFLLLSLGNLNDLVVGGDYVVNAVYIVVACFLLERSLASESNGWPLVAAAFVGICLSSRPMYFVMLVPLAALLWQRCGTKRAVVLMSVILCSFALVTTVFLLPDPLTQLASEMSRLSLRGRLLPAWMPFRALEVAALAVAAAAFFLPMSLGRVFAFSAVAMTILLLPVVLLRRAHMSHANHLQPQEFIYLAVPQLLFTLWTMRYIEETECERHPNMSPAST